MDGISGWIHGWKRNGWKTADKKPVKNGELWQALDEANRRHKVKWHWVEGHAGHVENERAGRACPRGHGAVQEEAPILAPFGGGDVGEADRGEAKGSVRPAKPAAPKPASSPSNAKPAKPKPRRSTQSC